MLQFELSERGDKEMSCVLEHVLFCVVWFQSAGIGGAAHLVNFRGTDTIAALMTARRYYNCKMAGNSIPAAEHR